MQMKGLIEIRNNIKEMNIYEKMSAIVNELGTVAKNLSVD